MPLTPSTLVRTTLPTATNDLFTASSKTVVKVIKLANKTGSDATAAVLLDGTEVFAGKVPANGLVVIAGGDVLEAGQKIRGVCSASNTINAHIPGTVIS